MKPIEKGHRKLANATLSAWLMLLGLGMSLAAAGLATIDTTVVCTVYLAFLGGLAGKDGVFVWGNRAEHKKDVKAD